MKRIIGHYLNRLPVPSAQNGQKNPQLDFSIVKGSHQRRMTQQCVKKTLEALKRANILAGSYADFEELYEAVRETIYSIPGIGSLAVYDISLRIGHLLVPEVLPVKYVYVARGALDGVRILFGKNVVKQNMDAGVRLPVSLFGSLFPNVASEHIEAILCIYKGYFKLGGVSKGISFANNGNCGKKKSVKVKSGNGSCPRMGKKMTIC